MQKSNTFSAANQGNHLYKGQKVAQNKQIAMGRTASARGNQATKTGSIRIDDSADQKTKNDGSVYPSATPSEAGQNDVNFGAD